MVREKLPNRRHSETHNVVMGGIPFLITLGYYSDGRIGEVFVHGAKVGSTWQAILDDASVLLSILIQMGYDPERLSESMCREVEGGAPSSIFGYILDLAVEHKAAIR